MIIAPRSLRSKLCWRAKRGSTRNFHIVSSRAQVRTTCISPFTLHGRAHDLLQVYTQPMQCAGTQRDAPCKVADKHRNWLDVLTQGQKRALWTPVAVCEFHAILCSWWKMKQLAMRPQCASLQSEWSWDENNCSSGFVDVWALKWTEIRTQVRFGTNLDVGFDIFWQRSWDGREIWQNCRQETRKFKTIKIVEPKRWPLVLNLPWGGRGTSTTCTSCFACWRSSLDSGRPCYTPSR